MDLLLIRNNTTADGIFGQLLIDGVFQCYTVENLKDALPTGTYNLSLYNSPDHGYEVPLLDTSALVPVRTFCEIHIANYPSQLLGCIGLGVSDDSDSVDSSKDAFDAFMAKFTLPATITIQLSSPSI